MCRCTLDLHSYFMFGYSSAGEMRLITWLMWTTMNKRWIKWVMRITAAYIHLKQLKATWDFLQQLHPALIGYHVRLKLCEPKLQPWVDVLMHIHITVGKLVNVKAVSQLSNMHTLTIPKKVPVTLGWPDQHICWPLWPGSHSYEYWDSNYD